MRYKIGEVAELTPLHNKPVRGLNKSRFLITGLSHTDGFQGQYNGNGFSTHYMSGQFLERLRVGNDNGEPALFVEEDELYRETHKAFNAFKDAEAEWKGRYLGAGEERKDNR